MSREELGHAAVAIITLLVIGVSLVPPTSVPLWDEVQRPLTDLLQHQHAIIAENAPSITMSSLEPDDLAEVTPFAVGNAPTVGTLPNPLFVDVGVSKVINVRVNDSDNDMLNVTWDWGDGSPLEVNTTAPALVAIRVYNEHAWTPPPEYTQGAGGYNYSYDLRIVVDDGNGNYAWRNTTILCYIPENYGPIADLEGPSGPVDLGDAALFAGMASDFEGEPLTWTFVFNNSESDYLTLVYATPASEPSTWVWCNITHLFDTEGLYNVTLFVSDAIGTNQTGLHNNSDRVSVWVKKNEAPLHTDITSSPQNPIINSTDGYVDVTFVMEVYDSDGDIITAVWDFGDSTTGATNITPGGQFVFSLFQMHRFTDPGEFNVTVDLTDGVPGNELVVYLILNIISNNLPPGVVSFSYAGHGLPGSQCVFIEEDVSYELLMTDPEMDDIELVWDFGDGSPLLYYNLTEYLDGNVSCQINHTYSAPGYYTIMITYTDNQVGLLDHDLEYSDTIHVAVDDDPPTADAGEDQIVYAPCIVYFDGTGSFDNWGIANYTWTFVYNGSVVVLWGPTPNFEFWSLQTYHVWLKVTDMMGFSDSTIVTIEVYGFIPEYSLTLPTLILMLMVPLLHFIRRKKGPA